MHWKSIPGTYRHSLYVMKPTPMCVATISANILSWPMLWEIRIWPGGDSFVDEDFLSWCTSQGHIDDHKATCERLVQKMEERHQTDVHARLRWARNIIPPYVQTISGWDLNANSAFALREGKIRPQLESL